MESAGRVFEPTYEMNDVECVNGCARVSSSAQMHSQDTTCIGVVISRDSVIPRSPLRLTVKPTANCLPAP
jgi:hypothetical protein